MPKSSVLKNRQLKVTLILLLLFVALLSVLAYIFWPYLLAYGDLERIKELVDSAGPWGPAVFLVMQVAQVVFAPVPGQVTGFVGGLLFGTYIGTLLSMIGTTIGFAIVFTLARKLGRPFVEYFISKKNLEKFDYLSKTKGVWVIFLIFLLPVVPDALAGYAVGLTAIKIRVLLAISVLGRLPGIFLLSFAGSETANANYLLVGGLFVGSVIIAGAAYLWRNQIENFFQRFAKKN
jgi:uncharacterized membrane protein YdjX (TVP38/TMEM64 family)